MAKVPRHPKTERTVIRFATPYLEVESRSIPSLERTTRPEIVQASHTATEGDDQPSSIRTTRPIHREPRTEMPAL